MRVNIIYHNNGVGLTKDAEIIERACEGKADVKRFDIYDAGIPSKADVNIFLEVIDRHNGMGLQYMKQAGRNVYFPNPEWYNSGWNKYSNRMNLICAKTMHCMEVFKRFSMAQVLFTSFTSPDLLIADNELRNYYLHLSGKSDFKGTTELIQAWKPDYPLLVVIGRRNTTTLKKNIRFIRDYLPQERLNEWINAAKAHICTSYYEGFGHYINEARSAQKLIITTDAAPMNQMCNDSHAIFVESEPYKSHGIVHMNKPTIHGIQRAIETVEGLEIDKLKLIGYESRRNFISNDKYFFSIFEREILNT